MNETRLESYEALVDKLKGEYIWSNMDGIVCFLAEIAGSLAVIADHMTVKKDGDAE